MIDPTPTPPLETPKTAPLGSSAQHAQTIGVGPSGMSSFLAQADTATERPGDEIGAYTLVSKLGEGGFGSVWLAERRKPFVQRVALKIIKAGMDSKSIITRFEQERQTLAVMNHPNVARVIDGGVTPAGGPYFVMEYVKGQAINEFCDARVIPTRDRLSLFIQVCEAVQHAHSKGIIHRDLKPGNILVSAADGEKPIVKVIDFGVAKALTQLDTDELAKEEEGKMVGTPEYMSPEQAEAENDQIDTRSDVYSLGVILYELISGLLPFDPSELRKKSYNEIQRTIREEAPPSLSERLSVIAEKDRTQIQRIEKDQGAKFDALLRDLKRELEWIPRKAMRKEPKNRYQTSAAMAEDIRRYLDGRALEAAPDSAWYRVRKQLWRYRVLASAAAGVLLALVIGLALALWQWREATVARNDAIASEVRAVEQRNVADAARIEATRAKDAALAAEARAVTERQAADRARERVEEGSYLANIQMANQWFEAGKIARTRERLDACVPQRRGWEWGWIDTQSDTSLQPLRMPARSEVLAAGFSPDGTRALTHSFDRSIRVWDTATGEPLVELKRADASLESAVFSNDGRRIASGHGDGMARVWDAASGAPVADLTGYSKPVRSIAFNREGSRVATASDDGTACLWNAGSGAKVAELKGHGDAVKCVAFSPDGRRVATASTDRTVRLWDASTGEAVATLAGHQAPVNQLAWSPDGTTLASGAVDGVVRVWNADGTAGPVLAGHSGAVAGVCFTPDGRRLLTGSDDRTARIWDVAAGTAISTLKGHQGAVISVACSQDGRLAVTAGSDGTARLWDLATGLPVNTLLGHGAPVFSCGFSPDGSRVITGSLDGTARLWQTFSSPPVRTLNGHSDFVYAVGSSPDGRRFVTASKDGTARIWNPADGSCIVLPVEGGNVSAARFNADGSTILTTAADNRVRLWNARTGASTGGLEGTFTSARFSPDGKSILTVSPDGVAGLWDAVSQRKVRELAKGPDKVTTARFNRDGTKVVTASADRVARIWDVASGALVRELKEHGGTISSASFSDDSRRVLTVCEDRQVRVWNAETGELLTAIPSSSAVRGAAFNRDGAQVLIWSLLDPTPRLVDVTNGSAIIDLRGHTEGVTAAEFSADGRRVLTTSADGTAIVWDAATGTALVTVREPAVGDPSAAITACAFLLDGTGIATASRAGPIRVWDAVPARVRFAERQFAQLGRSANLGLAFVEEPRGTEPPTWVTDLQSVANRPNFMQTVGESGMDPLVVSGLVRQALAEGRVEGAIAAARAWGLPKLDAAALNALAWQGLTKLVKGNPARDLNLLLECAQAANARVDRRDPALLDTLAHVHAERGERDRAVQAWKDALALLDAQPAPKQAEAATKFAAVRAGVQAALDRELAGPSAGVASPAP